jgi:ABC-type nitrate/sulfonate/bicarbonate transport system substrate-binding protein
MAGGSDSIEAAAQAAPIHAVWVDYQKLDLVCIGGPSIKTVKDLIGKNVGSTGAGGFAETTMTACLNGGGVQQSQVHEITMTRAEFVPALANGQIQAAVFHADDAYTVTHSIKGATILNYLYKSLPSYWYGSLNVTDSYATQHPLIVEHAIAAMILADRWMLNPKNNKQFISLVTKTTQESKSAVSAAINSDRSIRLWNTGCGVSPGSIAFTSKMLKNQGAITSVPSFAQVYNGKYCTAALSLIKASPVKG